MNAVSKIQPLTVPRGTIVFAEGEASNGCMYFIFSGEVEIARQGLGVLRTLTKGHFFGEMALVKSMPRTASATITSSGAKLGKIDLKTFAWLARNQPQFLNNLIGVVAKRAARALKRVHDAGI